MDPQSDYSGGVLRLRNDGIRVGGGNHSFYTLYESGNWNGSSPDALTFGKSSGLGDLELLSDPAPIEIGNLVWEDTDGDGVQDPGEPGISGVTVELKQGGTTLATATTDANGNYVFSNDPNGTTTGSHIYNLTQLVPDMDYTLAVPTSTGGNSLTTKDSGEGTNTDNNDSDADTGTGEIQILASSIPVSGANNHSFDIGYAAAPPCSVSETHSEQCDDNGTGADSSDDYYNLTVTGTLTNGSGNYIVKIDGTQYGGQTASGSSITLVGDGGAGNPTLNADGASTYTVRVEDATDASCFVEFTSGPVSSCSNGPSCSITQTHTTSCNDNGTAGDDTDDFFDLTVTGTVSNGSGNYVVVVNGYTSPSTASGTAVTIVGDGQGGNPTLAADGTSTYVVRVEDAADSSCFTEFTTEVVASCSYCPAINCGTATVQEN